MLRNTTITILIALFLSACALDIYKSPYYDSSINFMPMYGSPEIVKTEDQKKADEQFIESIVKDLGTRRKASETFATWGWEERRRGNNDNAMRTFNQSWLLDQNYYQPYWGFGAITLSEEKLKKAVVYYEKALNLIDEDKEKPRLQVDTAKAYAWQASEIKNIDPTNSEILYTKANALIDKALSSDPKYSKAYSVGGLISYDQGNYERAWKIVKKSRDTGGYQFDSKFIEALSKEMAEP